MGRHQRYDRTETVKKAMNLFWHSGFSGTSMRDLEAGLDMRPGSIYANFGSKQSLYVEALDLYAQISKTQLQDHIDMAGKFLIGVTAFMHSITEKSDTPHACMLEKTVTDHHPENEPLKIKAQNMIKEFEGFLSKEVSKAIKKGEISDKCDPGDVARYTLIQLLGLRSYAELQNSQDDINQLIQDIVVSLTVKAGIQS